MRSGSAQLDAVADSQYTHTSESSHTYLDHTISRTRGEPFVPRFHSNSAHPSQVTRNDPHELPLRMVIGLDLASFTTSDERLREEGRGSVGDGLVDGEG